MINEEHNNNNNKKMDNVNHVEEVEADKDKGWTERFINWAWLRTSSSTLKMAEADILNHIGTVGYDFTMKHVNIGPILNNDQDVHVWTFSSNDDLIDEIPVVLLHGLGSGLALFAINLKALIESRTRPIYAIDIPGFGRSSRPNYSSIPEETEAQLVQVIETWRDKMNLKKIIILGHSFAGYLSYSYGIRYPERVAHLILADPWGFKQAPDGLLNATHLPILHRVIANVLNTLPLNPLWTIRVAGPFGPKVIQRIRADLIGNFSEVMEDAENKVSSYIYHCNVQNPTGESAFYALMSMFGWAKMPMQERLEDLDKSIPLTLVYGSKSWVDHCPSDQIIKKRADSYVDFHILDANHHVYASQHQEFNQIVIKACQKSTK